MPPLPYIFAYLHILLLTLPCGCQRPANRCVLPECQVLIVKVFKRKPLTDCDASDTYFVHRFVELYLIVGRDGISALIEHNKRWLVVHYSRHTDPLLLA